MSSPGHLVRSSGSVRTEKKDIDIFLLQSFKHIFMEKVTVFNDRKTYVVPQNNTSVIAP